MHWIIWIMSHGFSSTLYFSSLLHLILFSAVFLRKNGFYQIFIWWGTIFSCCVYFLTSIPPFQMYKTPLGKRKLQLNENIEDHFEQRVFWDILKVPLRILQVPNIRFVFFFSNEHKEPLYKCWLPSGAPYCPLIVNMFLCFTYCTGIAGGRGLLVLFGRRKIATWIE